MNRNLLLLIFGIIMVSSCNRPSPDDAGNTDIVIVKQGTRERIDSTLNAIVSSGQVSGVSALIKEKGEEVYFNAFGYADKEAGIPMDRNTVVRIFSMTKPVTGVALMQLYEKGKFQLDDPLAKYIPEFADLRVYAGIRENGDLILEPPHRAVTIRDITRHTAGFANPDHPQLGTLVRNADVMNKENTLTQMIKKLGQLPLAFHPGDQWSYGISVDVQAYLVEVLSGKPFDQYVQENIFDPLGMTQTSYVARQPEKLAAVYHKAEDSLVRIPDADVNLFNSREWPLKPGGYGLISTIDDYMKFATMLLNEGTANKKEILRPETVRLMATNHLSDSITKRMWLPSKGQVGFGVDFAVRTRPAQSPEENVGAVGEFFWDGAASTLFWVDPVNELAAVLFVQILPFDRALHKHFRDAVYGKFQRGSVASHAGQ